MLHINFEDTVLYKISQSLKQKKLYDYTYLRKLDAPNPQTKSRIVIASHNGKNKSLMHTKF